MRERKAGRKNREEEKENRNGKREGNEEGGERVRVKSKESPSTEATNKT